MNVLAKIKEGRATMITKDVVKALAVQSGAAVGVITHFTPDELLAFANAIAVHQREQSASIFAAEPSEMWMARDVAEAIRKQGEEK